MEDSSREQTEYTQHAKYRMVTRGVVHQMVERTLKDFESETEGDSPGTRVRELALDEQTLAVGFERVPGGYRIISVWWK